MWSFNDAAIALIQSSDTFFVASYIAERNGSVSDGVDVSHRGGNAGFVRVDNNRTITIPDYQGNVRQGNVNCSRW